MIRRPPRSPLFPSTPLSRSPGERSEYYVPRIYWTSRPDTLAMITLNRPQNVMRLYFFDATTGGKRLVMSDSSSTWLDVRSEEHTSELQSQSNLVCRLLLEKN